MNRREVLLASVSSVFPTFSSTQDAAPMAVHVFRLGLATGISPELRARSIRTFNRFKQINAPQLMVVGRDVSTVPSDFEYAHISTFTTEAQYQKYMYDPIHLAADREAETLHVVSRGQSFDIYPRWTDDLAARLNSLDRARHARYQAHDDRPTSPPVSDRPQDQHWAFGSALFYVMQFSLSPDALSTSVRKQAFEALRTLAMPHTVAGGRATSAAQSGEQALALVLRFDKEASFREFRNSPAWRESAAEGLFAPEAHRAFFVIDPDDAALATRLQQTRDRV